MVASSRLCNRGYMSCFPQMHVRLFVCSSPNDPWRASFNWLQALVLRGLSVSGPQRVIQRGKMRNAYRLGIEQFLRGRVENECEPRQ
jgi:hypothetical protein